MRYSLESTLPINAFSPRGNGPFAYGMTLEGGGNPVQSITNSVSDLGQSIANVVSDAGTTIDKAVIQPALDDPAGTIVKIAAIAAAPATGGASLYAIPAYTATKALAAGVPLDDVAKMTAISAAATAAGVSVADYVGTMAEFGTAAGSQQTAMLAAQNVGIGTGGVASTAIGQTVGGAASGAIQAGATGGDIDLGLLSGAASGAIGAGVGATVDAAANSGLFNNVVSQANTGNTNMDDWLTESGYYDNPANIDTYTPPTAADFQMGGGSLSNQNNSIIPGELGDIVQDVNGNIVLSSGADIQAAQSLGFDATTLTNYAKQFGTAALKALLGSKGGTGGQNTGLGGLLGGAAGLALSAQQKAALQNAYNAQSQKVSTAATQAQNLAAFTPVGTTNFFGSSQFTRDPVTGQLTSAGFTPTAQVGGQMQNLFGLGAQALPTTTNPQAVAQQYIAQQQGLLAPGREQALASLENKQFQTGTTGLATGGTMAGYAPGQTGLMQTNPQLAAYYNSLAQQDAQLAANAPTYAQSLLDKQIATGTNLFGAVNTLQGYAQQPLTTSADLAKAQSAAGAYAGNLGLTGQTNAAQLAATGMLQGNAAMQGTYNQLGQTATGLGNTIANWLS
jgi:hypothetical protein